MSTNPKPGLSVVLATYNEEENLARCLNSVKDIADEIVIVDGGSEDETLKIAKEFSSRIIETNNPPIFHINKQKALDAAKFQWILQLDADEEVSDALSEEIKNSIFMSEQEIRSRTVPKAKRRLFREHTKILEKRDGNFDQSLKETVAFFTPRLNFFLQKPLRHGGVYPDGVIRLVKNGKAKFPCKSVHEQIQIEGRVDWLEHDLLHHDSPTFQKYIKRANRYTSLTAKELFDQKIKLSLFNDLNYLFLKPLKDLLLRLFRHRAYKDGFPGFAFALFSSLHSPLSYMKLRDLYYENRD